MLRILAALLLLGPVVYASGCGGDGGSEQADAAVELPGPCGDLCEPKEACPGDEATLKAGAAVSLIRSIQIGTYEQGFDFNEDGQVDNALAALGALANNPIKESVDKGELIIPFEFYDLEATTSGVTTDDCVHFAVYVGKYPQDADEDGHRVGIKGDRGDPGNDCFDRADDPLAPDINPGATETANGVDDNCNGLADETQVGFEAIPDAGCGEPSRLNDGGCLLVAPDTQDLDGDGVTVADGDCDDRDTPTLTIDGETHPVGWFSKPGGLEVCGDGLDNDCSGAADNGCQPYCDPLVTSGAASCSASYLEDHGDGVDVVAVDPLSLEGTDTPKISFMNGVINNGLLTGGPSLFSLTIPIQDGMNVDFNITAAIVEGTLSVDSRGGVSLSDAMLGGVLDGRSVDRVTGLDVPDISVTPDDTLLDLVFAGFLAKANLLGLRQMPCHPLCPAGGCLIPDVDVDGDGYECFVDADPDDGVDRVTLCVDGDGTEIEDGFETDANGNPKQCTEAMNGSTQRFVDGLSITLKFDTIPTRLGAVEPSN